MARDHFEELPQIDRLGERGGYVEVEDPSLHLVNRAHDDRRDARKRRFLPLPAPKLRTIHEGHVEVEEDQLRRCTGLELFDRLETIARGDDVVSLVLEDLRQDLSNVEVIIDDHDGIGPHGPLASSGAAPLSIGRSRGRSTVNTDPTLGLLSTVIVPLWASII
jgi:hypothetical protein